jgi:hypothetical protein
MLLINTMWHNLLPFLISQGIVSLADLYKLCHFDVVLAELTLYQQSYCCGGDDGVRDSMHTR